MFEISPEDFKRLVSFVYDNYGIDLSKKKQLIEGRLNSVIMRHGFNSFAEYLNFALDKNSGELENMLNKLTTNHTYFMRESSHFDMFRDKVLPDLYRRKKNRSVAVWSAGCSSGEEPYTLSMILKDFFQSKEGGWDTRVLATDISQRAMAIAMNAAYEEESLEKLPGEWKKRYLAKNGDTYVFSPQIRDNVIFRTFNLMSPIAFKTKFDVIFCRNVMIYFDQATKNALVRRFYDATEPGGYLFIGHAETIPKPENPYRQIGVAAFVKD